MVFNKRHGEFAYFVWANAATCHHNGCLMNWLSRYDSVLYTMYSISKHKTCHWKTMRYKGKVEIDAGYNESNLI